MGDLITTDGGSIQNVQSEVERHRAIQEVQARVLVAQKCPRDEVKATQRIMEAAKRKNLAENALYAYPKGGQSITGPSIRAAETMAKYWGNLAFGINELSQDNKNHISEVKAYCWDLETNVIQEKTFKVTHHRYSKEKGNALLTDPRDIYEKVANDGARRLRACILGIIPADIVEDFITECEKTLAGDNTEPLKDRVLNTIKDFEEFGVTKEHIEKKFMCKADNFIEKHLIQLKSIHKSIKDNFQTPEKFFDIPVISNQVDDPFNKPEQPGQNPTFKCSECGATIPKAVNDYSSKNFKRALCLECQKAAKKEES